MLHRENLVAALKEAIVDASSTEKGRPRCKLALLCAPGGYGKTTLLADLAHHAAFPCCWYALERADVDKITFLSLLLMSIRQLFPQFDTHLEGILENLRSQEADGAASPVHTTVVIDALTDFIAANITERFAIILCNYHEVNTSPAINALINRFLQRLPPQCVLIIESRAVPALELVPLVVRHEVFGLGSSDLRFNARELRDLARLQGLAPLTDTEAQQLINTFDGWIAGILLGTRMGDIQVLHQDNTAIKAWGSPAIRMDRQQLFAYLINEVFNREPDVYTFLKEACILQQMTPALCSTLLGTLEAANRLAYLEQQGLFVTRAGDGAQVSYTCHPLLRELLVEELRHQAPERFLALHLRAFEIFRASHEYEQAFYHALEAGAEDAGAQVIVEAYQQLLAQGYIETVARWIDTLSSETQARYPQLLIARASIYLLLDNHSYALPLLEQAQTALSEHPLTFNPDEESIWRAEIGLARSKALFQAGNYAQAQALCQQTLALLPADEVVLRVEAYLRLGLCANQLGDFFGGITHLQQALKVQGHYPKLRTTALLHSLLAGAYDMIGNYALSEHHRTRAIRCLEAIHDEYGQVNNLIGMGVGLQRRGSFAEAEKVLIQALTIARGPLCIRQGEAYALVSLGDLYQDQSRYDQALAVTEEGLLLAQQLKDRYLINYTLCTLALTYLLLGDSHTALLLVTDANEMQEASSEETMGYDKVIRELTRGTILLFRHDYVEALTCLTRVVAALNKIGLRREQTQALIRVAACHQARADNEAMKQCMEEATTLAAHYGFEHLIALELERLPVLRRALQSLPKKASPDSAPTAELPAIEALPLEYLQAIPIEMSDPTTMPLDQAAGLNILALGEPAVLIGKKLVTHWRIAKAMELFFYLLNSGRPVRKEQIIDALWPTADGQIDHTLRSAIYYLRKTIGEPCIVYRAGTYSLHLKNLYGEQIWYDVEIFQDHNATARAALAAKDDSAAKAAFQKMTEIYRGDYVQPFYSDWCILRRDELRRACIDAQHQLALIAWRHAEIDESIEYWQQLLAFDNCMEKAHYGLMRCYQRQGKRGLALRQYQRCSDALRDGLSAAPGSAIQNLYQRIIADDTH